MKKIRLFIADDHELVRRGLISLVSTADSIEVVGQIGELRRLPEALAAADPEVLLLDVKFPEGDSFHLCAKLQERHPDLKVLFLTSHSTDEVLFSCLDSGAKGFLLKDVEPDELIRAIEEVAAGNSVLDPSVTGQVLKRLETGPQPEARPTPPDGPEKLSPQEMRILELVARGFTNKEVADDLNLSPKTVKNYLSNAMGKLGFSRRAQAAAYWVKYHG